MDSGYTTKETMRKLLLVLLLLSGVAHAEISLTNFSREIRRDWINYITYVGVTNDTLFLKVKETPDNLEERLRFHNSKWNNVVVETPDGVFKNDGTTYASFQEYLEKTGQVNIKTISTPNTRESARIFSALILVICVMFAVVAYRD